jgi:hypothetical protein
MSESFAQLTCQIWLPVPSYSELKSWQYTIIINKSLIIVGNPCLLLLFHFEETVKILPVFSLTFSYFYRVKAFVKKKKKISGNSFFWLTDLKKSSPLKPLGQMNRNLVGNIYMDICMEGSVLSFLKAEWKVSDTGSAHWASSFFLSFPLYRLICHVSN